MHTYHKALVRVGTDEYRAVHVVVAVLRSCGVGSVGVGADLDFLCERITFEEERYEVFSLLRRELVRARFARLDC